MTMPDSAPSVGYVRDLPFGEQFLLWAVRQWVQAHRGGGDQRSTLHKGFSLAGIPEGYLAIDEFMTVVSFSTTTSIDVRCVHCASVSPDEQLFIGILAVLQRSDSASGRQLLSCWLPPAGIRLAESSAARLARMMALRGLMLRTATRTRADNRQGRADGAWPTDGRTASPTLH